MSLVLSNAVVVLLIVSFRFSVILSFCYGPSSYCGSGYVCCRNRCVYKSNCLYESCSVDSHCSLNESCCSRMCQYGSNCLGKYCSEESDCSDYEACCSGKCRSGYGCSGQYCSKKSDCSTYEACCSSKCRSGSDCSGKFCGSNNDCSVGQKCCSNTCSNYACDDPTAAIAIAVVSTIVGLSLVFMLIYCCNRPGRLGRSDSVEMGGQVATTVATTTQSAIHARPQAHQQDFSY